MATRACSDISILFAIISLSELEISTILAIYAKSTTEPNTCLHHAVDKESNYFNKHYFLRTEHHEIFLFSISN